MFPNLSEQVLGVISAKMKRSHHAKRAAETRNRHFGGRAGYRVRVVRQPSAPKVEGYDW